MRVDVLVGRGLTHCSTSNCDAPASRGVTICFHAIECGEDDRQPTVPAVQFPMAAGYCTDCARTLRPRDVMTAGLAIAAEQFLGVPVDLDATHIMIYPRSSFHGIVTG